MHNRFGHAGAAGFGFVAGDLHLLALNRCRVTLRKARTDFGVQIPFRQGRGIMKGDDFGAGSGGKINLIKPRKQASDRDGSSAALDRCRGGFDDGRRGRRDRDIISPC